MKLEVRERRFFRISYKMYLIYSDKIVCEDVINLSKKLLFTAIITSFLIITTGCGATKAILTGKVNPIQKGDIREVIINKGSSYQKKFTDINMISEMINNLNNVSVKKLSNAEDNKALDNGNALKKESTITLYFLSDDNGQPKSVAILLSEKKLYLPDVKSMTGNSRTISYINDNDETSLKSIKTIYSIAQEATKS